MTIQSIRWRPGVSIPDYPLWDSEPDRNVCITTFGEVVDAFNETEDEDDSNGDVTFYGFEECDISADFDKTVTLEGIYTFLRSSYAIDDGPIPERVKELFGSFRSALVSTFPKVCFVRCEIIVNMPEWREWRASQS